MILVKARLFASMVAGCALGAAMLTSLALAQTPESEPKNAAPNTAPETSETIFLSNATGPNDMNDIQTALRNNFTHARMYGVAGRYAVTVRASAEEMQGIKRMIAELDRPKKIYRVTYNISDVENGKRIAAQHYSLIVAAGNKTILRQGNRVPLIVGMTGEAANAPQSSQVQYIDVGLNIDASIDGTELRTKVEQTSVTEEKSGVVAPDPIIHQTMLEGMSALAPGKPIVLGSLDVPGSTRRQEIEVTTEVLTQ
jgi:type II secretory pathway component GspD/PulD (secretin)